MKRFLWFIGMLLCIATIIGAIYTYVNDIVIKYGNMPGYVEAITLQIFFAGILPAGFLVAFLVMCIDHVVHKNPDDYWIDYDGPSPSEYLDPYDPTLY